MRGGSYPCSMSQSLPLHCSPDFQLSTHKVKDPKRTTWTRFPGILEARQPARRRMSKSSAIPTLDLSPTDFTKRACVPFYDNQLSLQVDCYPDPFHQKVSELTENYPLYYTLGPSLFFIASHPVCLFLRFSLLRQNCSNRVGNVKR